MRGLFEDQKDHAEGAHRATRHLEEVAQDASGSRYYEGVWMVCTLDQGKRRKITALIWGLLFLEAALLGVCGCLRGSGMDGCVFVLLPYALCILSVCFSIRHMIEISFAGGRMREYPYKKHMKGLGPCAAAGMIFCILCIGARLAEAVMAGGWERAGRADIARNGILFLALQILTLAALVFSYRLAGSLTWKESFDPPA